MVEWWIFVFAGGVAQQMIHLSVLFHLTVFTVKTYTNPNRFSTGSLRIGQFSNNCAEGNSSCSGRHDLLKGRQAASTTRRPVPEYRRLRHQKTSTQLDSPTITIPLQIMLSTTTSTVYVKISPLGTLCKYQHHFHGIIIAVLTSLSRHD